MKSVKTRVNSKKVTGIHVQPVLRRPGRAGAGQERLFVDSCASETVSQIVRSARAGEQPTGPLGRARGRMGMAAELRAAGKEQEGKGRSCYRCLYKLGSRRHAFAADSRGLDATALGLCLRRLPFDPDFPRRLDRRHVSTRLYSTSSGRRTAAAERAADAATRCTLYAIRRFHCAKTTLLSTCLVMITGLRR